MKKLLTPLCVMITLSAASIAAEKAKKCDLNKLPIGRESSCESFFFEDDNLNRIYKKLITSLNKNEIEALKITQRKWINRRDEICQNLEEKAFEDYSKSNASRENETLDMCIIQLTADRAAELDKIFNDKSNKKSTDLEKFKIRYEN